MNEDMNSSREDETSFSKEDILSAAFIVSVLKKRFIAHVLVISIPVFIFAMTYGFFEFLAYFGETTFVNIFRGILAFVFFTGLILFINNAGKELVVSGRSMMIRRWFVKHYVASIDDVDRCEVMTNISFKSKYYSEKFSKAVIFFTDGGKISFNNNMYKNWKNLVRYMTLNEKTVFMEGNQAVRKQVDDIINR